MEKKILLFVTAILLSMASAFAQCNIITSASPAEGGTVSGGGYNIPCDTAISICAHPSNCYKFLCWYVDGVMSALSEECITIAAIQSVDLVAKFVLDCNCEPISSFPWTEGF